VDIVAETADVVAGATTEFPEATVSLSGPESLYVRAVPEIRVAVRNLVENACIHNDGTPSVEVRIESDADEALLSVVDDGPGIPDGEISVLESGEETTLEHGSGLGLWVTKWLVDRSDGSIEFQTDDPRGTVVSLRLPLSDTDAEVETDDSASQDSDAEPTEHRDE
jgi:signal transduction histidine kinase